MKKKLLLKSMLLLCTLVVGNLRALADVVTLVSGSGTSGYTIPVGWESSGTVDGGGYLLINEGTLTSPVFNPHTGLSFTYSVATFGSGTNHPLTIRILNASTNEVIVEETTATPESSSYINTGSPISLGDVDVPFKIQFYAPTGKGVRLRNYSITGTPVTSAYEITAASNNNSWGTVSLTGNVITATPAAGYTYADPAYTVSPQNSATVAQNGNLFTVTPSANTTVTINFAAIPTHTVTFSVNGVTTTEELAEGTSITFPDAPASIDDKVFMGWVSAAIIGTTDEAPAFVSSATMGNADVTYYACFATQSGSGDPVWVETEMSTITSSDVFVFATPDNYAIPNDGGTSAPIATAITVADGKITSNVEDKLKWNVLGSATGGYTFYPNGSTTTWLYCSTTAATSNNNNIKIGTGDRKVWMFDDNGFLKTKDSYTDRYLSLYSKSDFRGYLNTSNGAFVPKFYKYTSSVTYSNYCTTVVAASVARPEIRVAENPFLFNTTVTITCATDGAVIKYSFDGENWIDYSSALTITETTTIYAKAIKDADESSVATVTVTKNLAEPTVTISTDGITNTNIYEGTAAGSLSASVTYNDAAVEGAVVTWSGSNDDVATINASTGEVSLVHAGSVTFTATYAGNSDYCEKTATYVMTVTNENPNLETIWSEDFSSYGKNAVPQGGVYNYACTNGGSTTMIYTSASTGGESPELLVSNTNGTFSATIPLLKSNYGYSGDLVLTYKTNANALNVKTNTEGITVDGEAEADKGVTFSTYGEHTVIFKGVTTTTDNIKIVFTATSGSNVRLDDIVLKGERAELTMVATPVITPASGIVASGTEVTMTCATDGATIYYTVDGSDPTASSTAYDPANKPTITANTTIKAIGIKEGLINSAVATATYTLAEPCAAPTFSVAEGEVEKGTTVTIKTTTSGATIYYTVNGSTPTASSLVYSSAITINTPMTIKAIAMKDGMANSQVAVATYTIIDYATLPFSFAGGKSAIDATTGLTQEGLGSDYSGANPPLKFDGTGDNVVLKINEAPRILTFDIKGNSFNGSTFKVQTSANGVDYEDLHVYTTLGDTQTDAFALEGDVRYIKWIYTEKSAGNVGIGNIRVNNVDVANVKFAASGYATYCSPLPLDLATTFDYSAWIVTATESTTVTFIRIRGAVPPGTPVVLYGESFGGETATLNAATGTIPAVAGNMLKGTLEATYVETVEGDYTNFGLSGGIFKKISSGTIPANKAYLPILTEKVPAGDARLTIVFSDETTGIAEVRSLTIDAAYYNLKGQKVEKPGKGLYIVNGKKTLIK